MHAQVRTQLVLAPLREGDVEAFAQAVADYFGDGEPDMPLSAAAPHRARCVGVAMREAARVRGDRGTNLGR
jgi:hypothetical protein